MSASRQYTTEVLAGEYPIDALRRISLFPDELLMDAAAKGAVWVALQRGRGRTRPRRLRCALTPVNEGSSVMLNYNPAVLAAQPLNIWCVSDQVNYGIWFKPSGMLCQGSKWSDHTTATRVASGIRNKPCYLVHRLDRAACGLLLIAYTKNALRTLTDMFARQKIIKTYSARVAGECMLDLPMTLDTPIDDRPAITTLQAMQVDRVDNTTLLTLSIATGRKHQIRKHLAGIGYPIIGDRRYGVPSPANKTENSALPSAASSVSNKPAENRVSNSHTDNLQLVACALSFHCPFTMKNIVVSIDAKLALSSDDESLIATHPEKVHEE